MCYIYVNRNVLLTYDRLCLIFFRLPVRALPLVQ